MSLQKLVAALNEKVGPEAIENIIAEGEAGGFDVKAYLQGCYDKTRKYNLSRKFVEGEVEGLQVVAQQPVTNEHFDSLLQLADKHQEVGGKAKNALLQERQEFALLGVDHANLMVALLAKTGLKGVGKTAVKKHADIYEFEVMRGVTYDESAVKSWPIYGEPKHDGMRIELVVDGDKVEALSREGFEVKSFADVKHGLAKLAQQYADILGITGKFVLEAEGIGGDGSFNSTISALKSSKPVTHVKLFAFNIVSFDEFQGKKVITMAELRGRMISARAFGHEYLSGGSQYSIEFVPSVILETHGDAVKFYEQQRAKGLEGAIYKQPSYPYKPSKNKGWLKRKPKETVDVRILAVEEGIGESKGKAGAIVVDFKGLEVRVGSGLTNTTHRVVNGEKVLIPLHERPYSDRDRIYQRPEEYIDGIAELSYFEETPDGSLRHPVFERLRTDKTKVSYS